MVLDAPFDPDMLDGPAMDGDGDRDPGGVLEPDEILAGPS